MASDNCSSRERTLHHYRLASKIHRWFAKQLDEAFAFPEIERSRVCVDNGNAQCATLPTRADSLSETQNLWAKAPSLRPFLEQQKADESDVGLWIAPHHLETSDRLAVVSNFVDELVRVAFAWRQCIEYLNGGVRSRQPALDSQAITRGTFQHSLQPVNVAC